MAVNFWGIRLRGTAGTGLFLVALAALGMAQAQEPTEVVLHNFSPSPPNGAYPGAGLIRGPAGNLFGTAVGGGPLGYGVVFKLDTTGQETVRYRFMGRPDGSDPNAGVIRDSYGNLYGTTTFGGLGESLGVVYKLDRAGNETVLHRFTGGVDGYNPYSGVIRDPAGNLYRTARGGTADLGVVYKLDPAGKYTVLHSFTGGDDGDLGSRGIRAGLVMDSAGNIYGTTELGGERGLGTVYKVDPAGNETVLHSFACAYDGCLPTAGMILDPAGNLYGTTLAGGAFSYGVVFEMRAATGNGVLAGNGVLYSFTGRDDGCYPEAGVVRDSYGNLYGTTTNCGTAGLGVVYMLDTNGNETVLHSFTGGADGGNTYTGVTLDPEGNLYGTTEYGGTAGLGDVYKLDAAGHYSVLYSFPAATDGGGLSARVTGDSAGNLYGTAEYGGAAGSGIVYKLDATAQETVLYSFTGGADGGDPVAGVIHDPAGNLYGTTLHGGTMDEGVVYKLDTAGVETVLHSFTGGADGGLPYAGVIRDSAGNLYGTTYIGGIAGGVVYKLDPSGDFKVLHTFTGPDGAYPYAGLIGDSAGNLYGTTWAGGATGHGVVFKLNPARNTYTVLYSFTGGADGSNPYAGVIRDSEGNLYGTTYYGGPGAGVVYELDAAGTYKVLYSFTGGADGGVPFAGVIRDSAGNLYGTTYSGGTAFQGVVYKLDPAGIVTVLHNFTGGADGGYPQAGVIRGPAGNLFGTTQGGGTKGGGVVFMLQGAAP